jgi:hypothetical protein
MRTTYLPLTIALAGLVGFGVVLGIAGIDGWGNPAANEQAIGEISRWCERVSGGFFREPVNTLGNLAFVIAGLTMFSTLARDITDGRERTNRFIGNGNIAVLYAAAAVFLGPGSMVMHGTHTRFGAWVDNVSMVTYILIPWVLNVTLLARWSEKRFFAMYGTILGAYAAGYWFIGPDLGINLDLFGLSIGLWAISEILYRFWSPAARWWSGLVGFGVAMVFGISPATMLANPAEYWWVILFWLPGLVARHSAPGRRRYLPWYWVGVASFMVAFAIWQTGTDTHPACDPDSLIQAHAIWHILSAGATLGFFFFLRTERSRARDDQPAEVA